jgi:cell wall-associated NlpC family hydrolase
MGLDRAIWRAVITVSLVTGAIGVAGDPALAAVPAGAAGTALTRSLMAGTGYWVVNRAGGVASAGGAPDLGGVAPSVHLDGPIVAMAATPDGEGYWLASSEGGVYSLGDARYYGSAGSGPMARAVGEVVGMAATVDGRGYWLASAAGGVYSFGDAKFYGAAKGGLSRHIVGIVATPGGGGYWLVSSNGGVFCFGDATYHGSAAGSGGAIVGMAPTGDGGGYWLATAKGKVISFGDARAPRSAAEAASPVPVVGIAAEHSGAGYWFANSRGTTFGFGRTAATVAAHNLARDAVAIAADPVVVIPARSVAASPGGRVSEAALEAEVAGVAGQTASEFALSQVGKPYIWGATGPDGYDCSGLALASWAAAGVGLPRTAAEQYYAGEHVPLRQAQPGDLIFWASDPSDPATIYHVAISLGGDRTVQALRTGENVQVVDLWGEDLVPLATRP